MRSKEVRKILGVTARTLTNYVNKGILHPTKLNLRHYDYDPDEVYSLIKQYKPKYNVTYSRVSLPKQKNDLESQSQRLYEFAIANGIQIEKQITDIKSGMAFNERKGFNELLDAVLSNEVNTVIIENKDRLCRFGYDLLETVFKKHGTRIIVTSNSENKSYEQELTDDLISIIHHYSMKSYSHRRKLNNAEKALRETE